MYDEEEEEQVVKIKIPKYKILYQDLEGIKKEAVNNNNSANDSNIEKPIPTENSKVKEEAVKSNADKILECIYFLILRCHRINGRNSV
jgi:hypothetical protein